MLDKAGDLEEVSTEQAIGNSVTVAEHHVSIVFVAIQRAQMVLHCTIEDMTIHHQRTATQKTVIGGMVSM
jgi:hypothetical protein